MSEYMKTKYLAILLCAVVGIQDSREWKFYE